MKILLINPGSKDLRKSKIMVNEICSDKVFNYGILVLATFLTNHDIETDIIDLDSEVTDLQLLRDQVLLNKYSIVGISLFSYLSHINTVIVAKFIKSIDPSITLVIGGQHASSSEERLFDQLKDNLDFIVRGEGENALYSICRYLKNIRPFDKICNVSFRRGDKIIKNQMGPVLEKIERVNYELYPHFKRYIPMLEISRGCPHHCKFCAAASNANNRFREKSIRDIREELEEVINLWDRPFLPIVMLCSYFSLNPVFKSELLATLQGYIGKVSFLVSERISNSYKLYKEKLLPLFDQVHFGLESANKNTLKLMNKTLDPDLYLNTAINAGRYYKTNGVHVTLNIILGYIGEKDSDLFITQDFLEKNREMFSSIKVFTLYDYPGTELRENYSTYRQQFGCERIGSSFFSYVDTYPLSPSSELSFDDILGTQKKWAKLFPLALQSYDYLKWYKGLPTDRLRSFYANNEVMNEHL
ncbi:MAG: B12-binding domain-containing radical SAM protein [Bacteroidales bacterium]|jgi:radical SAM superfamily enzyme YgiQ (UPF0313 family)|nr:B12-binding domain-containing radical SAM protein [Bacteroidales bacterium]